MSDSAIGNFVIILLVKSGFFHKTDNIVISFADIKGGSCKRLVETDASYIIVEAKIYDTNGSGACAELEGNRNIFKPNAKPAGSAGFHLYCRHLQQRSLYPQGSGQAGCPDRGLSIFPRYTPAK